MFWHPQSAALVFVLTENAMPTIGTDESCPSISTMTAPHERGAAAWKHAGRQVAWAVSELPSAAMSLSLYGLRSSGLVVLPRVK